MAENYYNLLRENNEDNNIIEILNEIDIKREVVIVLKEKRKMMRRSKQERFSKAN